MVKHRKHCTSSAKVVGQHMTVKGSCPIKAGGKAKVVRVKARATKHTDVPPQCKGLKKRVRKACARRICDQRPVEYRAACKKAAGIR